MSVPAPAALAGDRPLIAHVLYSFDVGGLENGVVNLINHMPPERFRHVVVALAQCAPDFCQRVQRSDVEFISLHKPPGHGIFASHASRATAARSTCASAMPNAHSG